MDTPSPMDAVEGRAQLYCAYLDAFRSQISAQVALLGDVEARRARLASGWTPLELAVHLTFVERRWLVWGFLGEDVSDPWGDRADGRWHVDARVGPDEVLAALAAQGRRSGEIISTHGLDEQGRPSERWEGRVPPTLERICLHLCQEYARHAGHLDVVVELATSTQPGGAQPESSPTT